MILLKNNFLNSVLFILDNKYFNTTDNYTLEITSKLDGSVKNLTLNYSSSTSQSLYFQVYNITLANTDDLPNMTLKLPDGQYDYKVYDINNNILDFGLLEVVKNNNTVQSEYINKNTKEVTYKNGY